MDKRPIGIFDSGLGGLTAVSALRRLMPEENIVYFGDTARNPYGTRSVSELRSMAKENLAFLMEFRVKAILAACGTMSANVPDVLERCEIHVENVLAPSVRAMADVREEGPLAVIATEASIRSGAFDGALRQLCPDREILGVPCQEFVQLCETGHTSPDDPELLRSAERLLSPIRNAHAAAVLLGCTHFGLIEPAIRTVLGGETRLISAATCAAESVAAYLRKNNLTGGDSQAFYYTSGDVSDFEKKAGSFLGYTVKAQKGAAEGRLTC